MAGIQSIRKHSSGFFAKVIVGSIIVTFALFFGWGTVFTGSNVNNIAKINGNNINVVDLSFETKTQEYLFNQRFLLFYSPFVGNFGGLIQFFLQ